MKFFARTHRRRAGIYLVRTNKHRGRGRENGYVGRSNYVDLRTECHLGRCQHKTHYEKSWADLDPRWHWIKLPWWLAFKPVQVLLESIAIKVLMPRYNVQQNRHNPRRVPLKDQARQRAQRDRTGHKVATRGGSLILRAVGVLLILAGIAMPLVNTFTK